MLDGSTRKIQNDNKSSFSEYADVLAPLDGDPDEIFRQLQEMITPLEGKHESTNQTEYKKPGQELIRSLIADYPSANEIPLLILPTEDGWNSNPQLNISAPLGDAELVITSRNGRIRSSGKNQDLLNFRSLEFH